ncbi:hypothetical protein PR048_011260 [Dryococelus australis]|uniref:Uncharacterized protein n=1 Tax=Dryococelus australis TaxID=614101 RepID=A0ABQ9HL34_9NEOP|nr:hypothetical protein PR048_011260 [Dryococelus australis]
MGTYIGTNFADMKQSKKNAAVPLAAMSNTIKVNNETLAIDHVLKYELSPYPMTLFDEGCMRKTKKSILFDAFRLCSSSVDLKTSYTVVDGSFLLHRVKWSVGTKFSSICSAGEFYCQLKEQDQATLTARGVEAITTTGDADGSIVRCGLNKVTSHSFVVVIGEYVDVLVLQTAVTPPNRNVYFMKPG